jgi:CheY-like chemotaxis protein
MEDPGDFQQIILLATPDKLVCKQMSLLLNRAGFGLVITHNGEEACRIVRDTKVIRIILLDTDLPVLNGYEVARMIRQMGKDKIVIILLAWFSIQSLEMALATECNEYIAKPVVVNELYEMSLKWLKASALDLKKN